MYVWDKVGDKGKKPKVVREQKAKKDDEDKPKEAVKEQMVLTEDNVKKRMEEIQVRRPLSPFFSRSLPLSLSFASSLLHFLLSLCFFPLSRSLARSLAPSAVQA
eukprot:253016-Rhodomonas_salina.2